MIYGAKAPVEIFILHPGLKARAIHYKFYSMVVSLFLFSYRFEFSGKGPEGPGNSFYSLTEILFSCFYFHTSLRLAVKGLKARAIHFKFYLTGCFPVFTFIPACV